MVWAGVEAASRGDELTVLEHILEELAGGIVAVVDSSGEVWGI